MSRIFTGRCAQGLLLWSLVVLLTLPGRAGAQDQLPADRADYDRIMQTEEPSARLSLIEDFLQTYPESRYRISVLMQGVGTSAAIDPAAPRVLEYAERYREAYAALGQPTSAALAQAYAARLLAEAGAFLDTAGEWAEGALTLLPEDTSPRGRNTLANVLDVAALVASARGETDRAVERERQALGLSPSSAPYRLTLAGYLLDAGRADEAAPLVGRALLELPTYPDGPAVLDRLVEAQGGGPGYRDRLLAEAADALIAEAEDPQAARLAIAGGLAQLGALKDRVIEYAGGIGPEAGAAELLQARIALAQVYASEQDWTRVREYLEPVRRLASPYDTEFHLAYGRALEGLGRDQEAVEAYLAGTAMFDREPVLERLIPLWVRLHGSQDGLAEAKQAFVARLEDWEVDGTFEVPRRHNGRVVLAELFTGAECPPCVASDLAYDNLIAYYPDEVLAVLVYHLHIPGPDPMTNPDTEARMAYYGREIVRGTPTSIIDGSDHSVGGGGAAAAASRFGTYSWSIEQALGQAPGVTIDLRASRRGRTVSARADVRPARGVSLEGRDLRLRMVLAERIVHYTGGNGVAEHRMVVRHLLGGPDGLAVASTGRTRSEQSVDLVVLEDELLGYLDQWEEANARSFRDGGGFRAKTNKVADEDLFVVAFVQDQETREVLQARLVAVR